MTMAVKTKATAGLAFKLTRLRVIAIAFIILGLFIV